MSQSSHCLLFLTEVSPLDRKHLETFLYFILKMLKLLLKPYVFGHFGKLLFICSLKEVDSKMGECLLSFSAIISGIL